jgi:hypothetical protein
VTAIYAYGVNAGSPFSLTFRPFNDKFAGLKFQVIRLADDAELYDF